MDNIYITHKRNDSNASGYYKDNIQCLLKIWNTLEKSLQERELCANMQMYNGLINYINVSYGGWLNKLQENCQINVSPPVSTAVLSTGVNTPDHKSLFTALRSQLMEHVTSHICNVSSSNGTTLKSIMQCIVSQFVEEQNKDSIKLNFANSLVYSFTALEHWYNNISKKTEECTKLSKSQITNGPLVIILEDVESFPGSVLRQFTQTCAAHAARLPIFLIFGLATNMEAVHKLLGSDGCVYLSMERFASISPAKLLNEVTDVLFLDTRVSFRLGSDVYNFLLDLSLYLDFSVKNFLHRYKFCLMDHLHNSAFASVISSTNYEDLKINLSNSDIAVLMTLPSVKELLNSFPPSERPTSYKSQRRFIMARIQEHWSLQECTGHFLRWLFHFLSIMPSNPLGHFIKDVYRLVLESPLVENKEFFNGLSYMKTLSREDLATSLESSLTFIPDSLKSFRKALKSLLQELRTASDVVVSAKEERSDLLRSRMTRDQLRERLEERLAAKRQSSPLHQTKEKLVEFIKTCAEEYASWYKSHPLHEAFYFDDVNSARQALDPCPRAALHRALSHPGSNYLELNQSNSTASSVISSELPDICILYKLHLESSHFINVYDWLQAFCAVIGEETDSKNPPSALVQARFMRGVAELQHLGFVKSTKRKIDHVARLTWGAV